MKNNKDILPLYSSNGDLHSVVLSAELWIKGGDKLQKLISSLLENNETYTPSPEPLDEWELLKKHWDFMYPFNAKVECGCCGAKSEDWTKDADKSFRLKSAKLSGMLVFTCNNCKATVRKKHFKHHECYEFTPA